MKRLLVYIFIPVLAILLMSHNTYAADVTFNATDVVGNHHSQIMSNNWSVDTSGCISPIISNQWYDRIFINCSMTFQNLYVSIPNRTYQADDLIMVSFILSYADNSTSNHSTWFSNKYGGSHPVNLIDVQFENLNGNTQQVTLWLHVWGQFSDSNLLISGNNAPVLRLLPGTGGSNAAITPSVTQVWHINGNTTPSAQDIADAVNEPDEQASNDIQNQSSNDIGNSTNAETQSLLNAFGSFVSAIASISPSNCNVDFDLGHIDFGEQNLCSVSVPTVFTTITSILVIMFTIPFVYHLVNRILGLIREMQT